MAKAKKQDVCIERESQDNKMTDDERQHNIDIVQKLLTTLKKKREGSVRFVLSAEFEGEDQAVGTVWGPLPALMHLISAVATPVKRDMAKHVIAAAEKQGLPPQLLALLKQKAAAMEVEVIDDEAVKNGGTRAISMPRGVSIDDLDVSKLPN